MKIRAYQLTQIDGYDFANTLQHLNGLPPDDRFLDEGPGSIRLEHLEVRRGLLHIDFVKWREHGPGHLRAGYPITGFAVDVEQGDGFGEETAMLLNAQAGYLVVQYNHFGPRALSIADYVDRADATFLHPDRDDLQVFDFAVVLQPDALRRLRRMNQFRSIEAKISIPAVTIEDRRAGRALGSVMQSPMGGVETVTIRYTTAPSRDSSLTPDGVMEYVNQIGRLSHGVLQRLTVRGKHGDERIEEVDLFNDRLEASEDIDVGLDGRYPREVRWAAIERQYRAWRQAGLLGAQ